MIEMYEEIENSEAEYLDNLLEGLIFLLYIFVFRILKYKIPRLLSVIIFTRSSIFYYFSLV